MKNNFNEELKIIEKIKQRRIEKGLTQKDIAEKLFIDPVNYGRLERGQAKLTIEKLIKILEILDISFDEIFSDGEKNNKILKKIYKVEVRILKELQEIKKILIH